MENELEIQTTFNEDENMNEFIEGGDVDVQDTNNITE